MTMNSPKERPIIFSGPMVRAILRGENPKTQTRRVMRVQPMDIVNLVDSHNVFGLCLNSPRVIEKVVQCPLGQPGDRLWVRETWNIADPAGDDALPEDIYGPFAPFEGVQGERTIRWRAIYRASNPAVHPKYGKALWRPSIHMPRWASRITLEITNIRAERLQDISEADARAEGVEVIDTDGEDMFYRDYFDESHTHNITTARGSFETLWQSIHGFKPPRSWDANPWVWAIEFKRVEAGA